MSACQRNDGAVNTRWENGSNTASEAKFKKALQQLLQGNFAGPDALCVNEIAATALGEDARDWAVQDLQSILTQLPHPCEAKQVEEASVETVFEPTAVALATQR